MNMKEEQNPSERGDKTKDQFDMYLGKSPKTAEFQFEKRDVKRLGSGYKNESNAKAPRGSILAQSVPQPLSYILQHADQRVDN